MNDHNSEFSKLNFISPIDAEFEVAYLKIRRIENRVYTDDEVKLLPASKKQTSEWKLRAKSADRFKRYLAEQHAESLLLEIGCGNGWFTNFCSNQVKKAVGVDINSTELKQATKLFGKEKTQFYYWNLFDKSPFVELFDLIVLNASVQYFEDFKSLVNRLKSLLKKGGEIHIIDSPFYKKTEISSAKERTQAYYAERGASNMAKQYFHHDIKEVADFEELYKGKRSKFQKLFFGKDSPFSWYRLKV